MAEQDGIEAAAEAVAVARLAGRPLGPLPGLLTVEDGYRAQDLANSRLEPALGARVGHKIGGTTARCGPTSISRHRSPARSSQASSRARCRGSGRRLPPARHRDRDRRPSRPRPRADGSSCTRGRGRVRGRLDDGRDRARRRPLSRLQDHRCRDADRRQCVRCWCGAGRAGARLAGPRPRPAGGAHPPRRRDRRDRPQRRASRPPARRARLARDAARQPRPAARRRQLRQPRQHHARAVGRGSGALPDRGRGLRPVELGVA